MKSKTVWALVALNVLLLAALIGQWARPNTATAQAVPRPSDYLMVPGNVSASPAQVVYIVDEQNGLLSARVFNGQTMADMKPINLQRIFKAASPGATPRRGHG